MIIHLATDLSTAADRDLPPPDQSGYIFSTPLPTHPHINREGFLVEKPLRLLLICKKSSMGIHLLYMRSPSLLLRGGGWGLG